MFTAPLLVMPAGAGRNKKPFNYTQIMESYESLIREALEMTTPRARYERVMQLIEKEKQLTELQGWMQAYKTAYEALQNTPGEAKLGNVRGFFPKPIQSN